MKTAVIVLNIHIDFKFKKARIKKLLSILKTIILLRVKYIVIWYEYEL